MEKNTGFRKVRCFLSALAGLVTIYIIVDFIWNVIYTEDSLF